VDFCGFFGYNTKNGVFLQEQNFKDFPPEFSMKTNRQIKIRPTILIFGLIFCLGGMSYAEDWFAQLDSNSFQRRNQAWNELSTQAQTTETPVAFLHLVQKELQDSTLSFEAQERLEILESTLEKRLKSEPQTAEESVPPSTGPANPSVWQMLTAESPVKRNLAEREIRFLIRNGQKLSQILNQLREIIVQDSLSTDDRLRVWKLEQLARQKWLENADFQLEISETQLKESVKFLTAAILPEDRLVPWMNFDERTRTTFSISIYEDPFGGDGLQFLDFEDYKTGKREGLKIWRTVQLLEDALVCEKTRERILKFIQESLASESVTPTGTILLKRLQFLTVPCMAAEYWLHGTLYRAQILQIGVPQNCGMGVSFFDSSTDETAHCQQGTNLATRDYVWETAIRHPNQRDAFFHLVPLKTVESKLLYASRIVENPERRLRLISEKTLRNLPESDEEKRDLVELLCDLDVAIASRKAGEWLLEPAMKNFEPEICAFLLEKGTKEAVPGLLRRLEGEPILKENHRVDWLAALAIAERDPWDGVDTWLKEAQKQNIPLEERPLAENNSPMVFAVPNVSQSIPSEEEKNAIPTLVEAVEEILKKRGK